MSGKNWPSRPNHVRGITQVASSFAAFGMFLHFGWERAAVFAAITLLICIIFYG